MKINPISEPITARLRAAWLGVGFAVLTIIFGQTMGIVFGINEAMIKSRLSSSAAAVQGTAYKNDSAAMKAVLDKSWVYMQRAHLHAGGMGTTAVVLILLLCLLGATRRMTAILSAGLGIGGLGYSIYWMWAGFRAPWLGGTTAAKESLSWLAMPSSGAFVLATLGVFVVLVGRVFAPDRGSRADE